MDIDETPEAIMSEQQTPLPPEPKKQVSRIGRIVLFMGLVTGALAAAFFLTTAVIYARPTESSSKTVFEILPRGSFVGQTESLDPAWTFENPDMEAEIGKIGSYETFSYVEKNLELMEEINAPDEESAIKWMREHSKIKHLGGNLVEISTYGISDPKLAAKIAASIVESYYLRIAEFWHNNIGQLLQELELNAKAAEMLVDEKRDKLLRLSKDSNIVDLAPQFDYEIETPLMRRARNGTIPLTPEEIEELLKEQRRMSDMQATKAEYIEQVMNLRNINALLARVHTGSKLPRKYVEIHQPAKMSLPMRAPVYGRSFFLTMAWLAPTAIACALALYVLILSLRRKS